MKSDVSQLLKSQESIDEVPVEALPALLVDASALLGRVAAVQARIAARLMMGAEKSECGPDEDRLIDVPTAAGYLALKPQYLYGLIRAGRFPAVRVGKYVRVRFGDMGAWVQRATTGQVRVPDSKASEYVRRVRGRKTR